MKKDIDYFIRKFEAIPEENWCIEAITKVEGGVIKHCILGQCKAESLDLYSMLHDYSSSSAPSMVGINDGIDIRYPQATPKQRVLACLNDIKRGTFH